MMMFKVLAGIHIDRKGREYKVGDNIETNEDLVDKFGEGKFQRVDLTTAQRREPKAKYKEADIAPPEALTEGVHTVPDRVPGTPPGTSPSEVREINQKLGKVDPTPDVAGTPPDKAHTSRKDKNDDYEDDASYSDTFGSMTVPQLESYADQHGVDLGNITKKADIIAALREHSASKV